MTSNKKNIGKECGENNISTFWDEQDKISAQCNFADLDYDSHVSQESQILVQMVQDQCQQVEVKEMEANKQIIVNNKPNKKKSPFHNFDKHMTVTLREMIDASRFGSDPETAVCQKRIWKAFKKSSKINKTLVNMVIGDLTQQQKQKLQQYGFKQIIRAFKAPQIKQAQQNIYQQIIHQLSQINIEQKLKLRRMRNKKDFVVYFKAFVQELIDGKIGKRITKCTELLKYQ